jgi:hypothetical protein
MNVSGPLPLPPVQRPDEVGLALRVNERIAAEVLRVEGDQVQLAMEGARFVARLTSPDQAAALAGRKMAHFIVRDTASPTVALQLLPPPGGLPGGVAPQAGGPPDLAAALLPRAGLPADEATQWIARALLGRGLQVTPGLVAEFHLALAQIPGWGEQEARLAAALKSLGLPVTPGTIALAGSPLPSLAALLGNLRGQVEALLQQNQPSQLAELLREALRTLDALRVDWSDGTGLAEKVRLAIGLAGRALERELSDSLPGRGNPRGAAQPENSLLRALGALRRELAEAGLSAPGGQRLADTIEGFLDGLRRMQLINVKPESAPERGQWLSLDVPLGVPHASGSPQAREGAQARLRIAVLADGADGPIDPANTHLVIQVDLGEGENLLVDCAVVNRRIGARVLASSEALRLAAEAELPGLRDGLAGLGYVLLHTTLETGIPAPLPGLGASAPRATLNQINVTV